MASRRTRTLGRLIPAGTGLPPYKRLKRVVDDGTAPSASRRVGAAAEAAVGSVADCANTLPCGHPLTYNALMHEYRPGQVWNYRNRPRDEGSTVRILRVDHLDVEIIHVLVEGLRLGPDEQVTKALYPVSREALDASVTSLVRQDEAEDSFDGYDEWRASFDKGMAGFWTGPLGAVVNLSAQRAASSGATDEPHSYAITGEARGAVIKRLP